VKIEKWKNDRPWGCMIDKIRFFKFLKLKRRRMKSLLSFTMTMLVSVSLHAQGNARSDTTLVLSSNPSVVELTRLFSETTAGNHDPFQVLPKVASLGNKVVPALNTFLFDTPVLKVAVFDSTGKVVDSVNETPPNRVYGVMALDLIGTPAAYKVLAVAAQSDTNNEVRGEALRAIAQGYYYKTVQDSLSPDKEVVHLLIQNMEDTTFVQGLSMEMGEIARQGFKNWTGIDYGEILPDSLKAKDEKAFGVTLLQHHEQQWQRDSGKMKWNKNTGHFEIENGKGK
jgi:hypothetical protein